MFCTDRVEPREKIANVPDDSVTTKCHSINVCATKRLGCSRKETIWHVTKRNDAPERRIQTIACNSASDCGFPFVISRLFNAVRTGVAGAVALASAYGVSMPQKANADLITSHADVVGSYAPEYRDVLYNSLQVNYRDIDGDLIPGGLTNNVVLIYVGDVDPSSQTINEIYGGLTILAGESQTDSGWFWSNDGIPGTVAGMVPGQVATNGLNGGSYWTGGIDLNGNGSVGNFNGTTIAYDPNEGMVHEGDSSYVTGEYYVRLNGIPAHPGSGTGPITIDSIDIYAPWQMPESEILSVYMSSLPEMIISNASLSAITVQRSSDLLGTNWLNITNFLTSVTNFTDTTATGDWKQLFYRILHE